MKEITRGGDEVMGEDNVFVNWFYDEKGDGRGSGGGVEVVGGRV